MIYFEDGAKEPPVGSAVAMMVFHGAFHQQERLKRCGACGGRWSEAGTAWGIEASCSACECRVSLEEACPVCETSSTSVGK